MGKSAASRLAFESNDMNEQSRRIKEAGSTVAPPEEDTELDEGTSETGNPTATDDAAVTPIEPEVPEPPTPVAKTPAEMNQPPEAFLDPENPSQTPVEGGEKGVPDQASLDKPGAPEAQSADEPNQQVVKDMGGGGLNDVLTDAFKGFLEGGSGPKSSMEDQSNSIKKVGAAAMSRLSVIAKYYSPINKWICYEVTVNELVITVWRREGEFAKVAKIERAHSDEGFKYLLKQLKEWAEEQAKLS